MKIEDRPWLCKKPLSVLDGSLLRRLLWHKFELKVLAQNAKCNVLFSPGGIALSGFYPSVTMCRNMLPFEWREIRRPGFRLQSLKLLLLRWVQLTSFQRSSGLIFLTAYARGSITKLVRLASDKVTTIPHGICLDFFMPPRSQLPISKYSAQSPYTLVYVSKTDLYKHHDKLVYAVGKLRNEGYPLRLILAGPKGSGALNLEVAMNKVDQKGLFISYIGSIPYNKINVLYQSADLGVFASTCENMPNILIELMASGLPIACSSSGPMPEVLGEGGEYFEPEISESIANCLRGLIDSPERREEISSLSFKEVEKFSWKKCAESTFSFLEKVSRK
jgi:glycosyltransferase involved in cell wall biosynthesis